MQYLKCMIERKDNIGSTGAFNDKYSSLIRPIRIFLPVSGAKKKDGGKYDDFVGRERLMEKLFNWLSDKSKENGSYLVTGFRGMGKTVLVERVVNKLTREVKEKQEPWWLLLSLVPIIFIGILVAIKPSISELDSKYRWITVAVLSVWLVAVLLLNHSDRNYYKIKKKKNIRKYPNHKKFDDVNVDKMARGKNDDFEKRQYSNIKISVNLGHEVLRERDVLSMIATSVRDKYRAFVKSSKPHLAVRSALSVLIALVSLSIVFSIQINLNIEHKVVFNKENSANNVDVNVDVRNSAISIQEDVSNSQRLVVHGNSDKSNNQQVFVNGDTGKSLISRVLTKFAESFANVYNSPKTGMGFVLRFAMYLLCLLVLKWLFGKLFRLIPHYSTPLRALHRLDVLTERLNTVTGEESSMTPSAQTGMFTISLFNRRVHKTKPIADIREIETELSEIINMINSKECPNGYQANFIVVFDEMDKIDPAMMEHFKTTEMPEFTDSVKGFPDGMDSRERRRNVLKLLANIKLFVSTARAKFVFISGRELYDAYLADLSDRDFAISSIFSGVINVDSFLTPEGGQTDVRSMSEWYITNRLIPRDWLEKTERKNAEGIHGENERKDEWAVLKSEKPSLRWYYEYLVEVIDGNNEMGEEEKKKKYQDAMYVMVFLHTFAAYLTHISNGSPKKIFLYFDKYIRYAKDCLPMNDWNDVCSVGEDKADKNQRVLCFEPIQQKTINFVYYLSNPIMGTITNDMSNYGDRFLVSLSFIIDHIYKYHNRSFSWRNLEQIPDLLKTSKAPELRDEMTSIMEYLSQIHISPILIGLNEYKFHKSIAEEISVMSKMSDEASAIFNFTLDESLSVIQYNTRLLNYYINLDKEENKDKEDGRKHRYLPLIARIHSNLGDLHFWDEDYYSATLEYRAAIETLPTSEDQEDESGFLTRVRCMLKLGLAYELRKLYPNAYQTYCRLINLLIKKRWVDEADFGLSVIDATSKGWQDKRQVMINKGEPSWYMSSEDKFKHQFKRPIFNGDYNDSKNERIIYSLNFDGIVTAFAKDLTVEKARTINTLTLFEEIRYLYQSILAKLSILEKMDMSGITQTNIEVAEGEFRTIHKSVNLREKFIIAADFFRKLAEILYYKNNLTILTQNQDSFYASVYYDDHDLLANLDDFCMRESKNALTAKHDIRYFFFMLNNCASDAEPKLGYPDFADEKICSLKELYKYLMGKVDALLAKDEKIKKSIDKERIANNVMDYLRYNSEDVAINEKDKFNFGSVEICNHHTQLLRERGLRTPCYACKYYTRSLRILADNMFENDVLDNSLTKSIEILKHSFKNELLYTNSANIRALAQTLEGFGNVMFSCASGDDCECERFRPGKGLSVDVIELLQKLSQEQSEEDELIIIEKYEERLKKHTPLSRLDKSILYYWDAYRFYLMDACYNDAIGCLNKILNIFVYYIEVVCYYEKNLTTLLWKDESDVIYAMIGDAEFNGSFVATLFQLIARYSGYKYDFANMNEINELKWIYSKEMRDNIDLTKLSFYPVVRSAWLRAVEIRAKGLCFLGKNEEYVNFIGLTYPLVAPRRRYETTFYEEVMGYYTKMRYNGHILNNLMGGTPMVDEETGDYANPYHIAFYEKLFDFLKSPVEENRLDFTLFEIGKKEKSSSVLTKSRLELLEFLIHDTLVCITNMLNVFTPHNHLTSYSKSFVGLVYNYFWEWSKKYEFLYSLYQYQELLERNRNKEAEKIIGNIWGSASIQSDKTESAKAEIRNRLREVMGKCSRLISLHWIEEEEEKKYGSRSDRLYGRLRHDIDDITLNTIYSNYSAEMALKYYQMAIEANTEGEAYREMIGSMHFLNDDMNNDTCQFNIACDRFLLNTGVVAEQCRRLEKLYVNSNIYNLSKGYIDGPDKLKREALSRNQFDRSQFINSEY